MAAGLPDQACADRVVHDALHIVDDVGDVEHDAQVAREAAGGTRRRVHVVARRERVRVRQRGEKHLHADQELLQPARHVVHVVRRPVLRATCAKSGNPPAAGSLLPSTRQGTHAPDQATRPRLGRLLPSTVAGDSKPNVPCSALLQVVSIAGVNGSNSRRLHAFNFARAAKAYVMAHG